MRIEEGMYQTSQVTKMADEDVIRTEEDRIIEVLVIEGQNRLYEDGDFMPVKQSLYLSENMIPNYDLDVPYLVWCRPDQMYAQPEYFCSEPTLVPYGVQQGTLPDEVFLGVLMAIATYPTSKRTDLMSNIFASRPEDFAKYGVYTCRFYVEGAWVDVTTDTSLPCCRDPDSGEFTPAYGASCNQECWVGLAQKAYAKAVGSYEGLQKVRVREALLHLTGGSVQQMYLQDNAMFENEPSGDCPLLWKFLNKCKHHDTLVLVEPKISGGTETDTGFTAAVAEEPTESKSGEMTDLGGQMPSELEQNLVEGRLYSVVGLRTVGPEGGSPKDDVELVLMHDPWSAPGEQCWFGDWGVTSPLWDSFNGSMLDKVEMDPDCPWRKDAPNGYFFMPLKAFKQYFNSMHLCKLFPEDKFNFYCMAGDWHATEAGGPYQSVRDETCLFLEEYCSILLLSYYISSGALESPDLLLSYSMITFASHNIIIIIITLTSFPIFQPLNHFKQNTGT